MNKYGNCQITVDNIKFHSKMEADFYLDVKLAHENGEIKAFELQPNFILLPSFKKNGKTFRPITYKADFKITNNDDTILIIDVKGMETKDFLIKKKLFEYTYKDLSLLCVTYVAKYGGWINKDKLNQIRKQNRKNRRKS